MQKIKVIIADDHQLFRRGLVAVLKELKGIEVIDEAANGKELLAILKSKTPDVVLVDIKMPVMDGIETIKVLLKRYPDVKVIMLTMHNEETFITHVVNLGAHGYLLKNTDIDEVEMTIKKVMEQGFYFSNQVSDVLLNNIITERNRQPELDDENPSFSKREKEVLQYICDGYTNSEIADKLFLSTRTVEGYRYKLCEKVGVKNTAGLVRFAVKNGLVD